MALSIAAGVVVRSIILGSAGATEPTPISLANGELRRLPPRGRPGRADRLVWIQFTGPWCPNCMRMERDSFPDADVIDHSQRSFVPLKLRSDVHERLALDFNLSGLPATVLIAPTREVIAIRQGYLGPDELERRSSDPGRDRLAIASS